MKVGFVGMMLSAGETVLTSTGRETTPFPKLSLKTNRGCTLTEKRVNQWLIDNAILEAESRGDEFNLIGFKSENKNNLPPASVNALNYYLFDPDWIFPPTKKILKEFP